MGQKKSKPEYCDCLFLRYYYDGLYLKIPEETIKFDIYKTLDPWMVNKKNNAPVNQHTNWPITKSLVINVFDRNLDMNLQVDKGQAERRLGCSRQDLQVDKGQAKSSLAQTEKHRLGCSRMNDLSCVLKYLAESSLDYLYIKTATIDQMLFMLQNMSFVRIHTLILELDQNFYSSIADEQKKLYEAKIIELKDTMDLLCYYRKIEISTLFYFDTNNTRKFFGLSI